MSKKNTFETKLARLEEIVNLLDSETIALEESAKLFEEGVALSKELSEKLNEVKFKESAYSTFSNSRATYVVSC